MLYDTNDVTSSAGAFEGGFLFPTATAASAPPRRPVQPGARAASSTTGAGVNTRKVEPRNTPTVVNAAFMRRNFWDGRASNTFNGVDPFGAASIAADPTARIVVMQGDTPVLQALAAAEHERRLAGGRAAAQRLRDGLRRAAASPTSAAGC